MKCLLLLLSILFLATGCSTINLHVNSRINPEYSFDKKEKIFVKADNTSSIEKLKLLEILKTTLVENNFIVVDSSYKADRILEIYTYGHQRMQQFMSKGNSYRDILNLFEKPYFDVFDDRYSNRFQSYKSGYSKLYVIMSDTTTTKSKHLSRIWYSSVLVPTEKIDNYPTIAIKLLLKQYGIDETYYSSFPKKLK